MAENHVAANLLMLTLLFGGLFSVSLIKQEIFPDIELDIIEVSVSYFGAGLEDIEEGILLQVEDALRGIEGIKEIRSVARQSVGQVFIEVLPEYNTDIVLQDVKNAVDRIVTFPEAAERPIIKKLVRRRQVLYLAVYGDTTKNELRDWAERIRDELLLLPDISQVELEGVSTHEITVSISEDTLRRFGITLNEVASLIRKSSLDIPAGQIRTAGGKIQIRTKAKRYWAREYKDITILTKDFGLVRLGDIATLKDSFRDTDILSRFDEKPAIIIDVFRTGDERPTKISKEVKDFVKKISKKLPPNIYLSLWKDRSIMLKERIRLLLKNALMGLILVIVILGAFLEPGLAFWVMLGIPVSFLGAMAFMPFLDVSINMISLFAFIMALGIVVDDAIVVGENCYEHRKRGLSPLDAATAGTAQVALPVIFSVLTTGIAFSPLLFIEGSTGKFISVIPKIVITILAISLFECLFILPSHLNTKRPVLNEKGRIYYLFTAIRFFVERNLSKFLDKTFEPGLKWLLKNRSITVSFGIGILILTIALVASGIIKFHFMPKIEADTIKVTLKMLPGASFEETVKLVDFIEKKAKDSVRHFEKEDPDLFRHIYSLVSGPTKAKITLILAPSQERHISSSRVADLWRKSIGSLPGIEYIRFQNELVHLGENIHIRLYAKSFKTLEEGGEKIKNALSSYPGVKDISFDLERGEREIQLHLKPEARALGITSLYLGSQIRGAFYGAEAIRMMRGENEVWIMAKYPEKLRRHLSALFNMWIKTPDGERIPLKKAATIKEVRAYNVINRVNRLRVMNITASVDEKIANSEEILNDLKLGLIKRLQDELPGLKISLEGQSRASFEAMTSMKHGFVVALFIMYLSLAIPFRSYFLPIIVMSSIPFGIVGAIFGHLLLGYNLSIMSLFGMVALSGVVVNDSLLLLDYGRRLRNKGYSPSEAILLAAKRRFRPIILTSLTTFFGLSPLILEKSVHAKFLIPMAISLAFGILFATFVTLILIPVIYLITQDLKNFKLIHSLF